MLFNSCSYIELRPSHIDVSTVENSININNQDSLFYYSLEGKVSRPLRKDLLLVQFEGEHDNQQFLSKINENLAIQFWRQNEQAQHTSSNFIVIESTTGNFTKEKIAIIKQMPEVVATSFLCEHNGLFFAPTNRFFIKLKNSTEYGKLQEFVNKMSCEFIESPWGEDNVYLISVPKSSKYSALELANTLYETTEFEFAAPNFRYFNALCSNDTYYGLQWGLKNTGQYDHPGLDINIEDAWEITEGDSSIKIAVIDTGVDLVHPDLQGQLLPGYDTVNNREGGGPSYRTGYGVHGTKVAGVIGAIKDNNIGIAGVAPNCKIIPIHAFSGSIANTEDLKDAIYWAVSQGADILNCSFDMDDDPTLINAINYAASNGRNGRGCVIVAAAGNQGTEIVDHPACMDNTLGVGAINLSGTRLQNSNFGSGLDVVAPGDRIMTLDITEFDSSASGDYTSNFNMSSAATPFVSGIAALILSKYPDLYQSQVRRSIELSCDRLTGYVYNNDCQTPVGMWNNEVGYGIVNAYSALLKAEDFHQENMANSIPGIDFEIINESSHIISNIYVCLTGIIAGNNTLLFSADPGSLEQGQIVGFPTYRGEDISESPGSIISNLCLELYAECHDYSGNVRVSISIEGQGPIITACFDSGNSYNIPVPNIVVPNASRKKLYITITDTLN